MRNDNGRSGRGGSNRGRGGFNRDGGGRGFGGHGGGFNRGGFDDRPPREMHKAICADCNQECDVPFKPTEGKPVYCRECFQKHRPPRRF